MALKLLQVLDLAIGVDNASVNLMHLREVLLTVITTLDIGSVAVNDDKVGLNEPSCDQLPANNGDKPLPEDETREITSIDEDESPKEHVEEDKIVDKVIVENEGNAHENENDTEHHETNDSSGKLHTSSKRQTMEPPKLTRSESAFSNISKNGHNSTLSSKVFSLEENLKRLQSIVGSLISQVDGNSNVILPGQFGEVNHDTADLTLSNIRDNSAQYRERSGSMGTGHDQFGGSRLDSGRVGGRKSDSELRRPVTQPVLTSSKRKPELPRSKTAAFSERRNKPLIRQGSTPIKLKLRQFVPTIVEETQQGERGIEKVTNDSQDILGEFDKEGVNEDVEDIHGEAWIDSDVGKEIQPKEENLPSDTDSEEDIEDTIEQEIEAALNDPSDPRNTAHALRLGLKQMQRWREEFQMAQENFRLEMEACRNYIQSLDEDMNIFKADRKNQATETFNALHLVHRQIIELEQKQAKLSKTVNELVDEYNRHDTTFSDILNSIAELDDQKVDKVLLSTQVNDKANKDELRDKVSMSTFDESFSLLDKALNDALEKMANQMSVEEAMRETLNEMQSGIELKLNREDMENLRKELETRIKEVRAAQEKGLVGKDELPKDPAGFKRFMEKVRCISCDRDVEIGPPQAPTLPSLPKTQPLAGITRSREVHMKKTADDEHRFLRQKPEMFLGTGLHDLFPMSRRFCGGRHTITRGNRRPLGPSLNDYIVVRESDHVSLPSRQFIVSKDSGFGRLGRRKLPAINDGKHLPEIREERNILKENGENILGNCEEHEHVTGIEKQSFM